MLSFNQIVSGLKKRGVGLTEEEHQALRGFIENRVISPAFVQRVVQEHGLDSVGAVYFIRDFQGQPDLDYLLRRHKGSFYRKRYPSLSFINSGKE